MKTENCTEPMNNPKNHDEDQQIPSKKNKSTPRYIIIKLQKTNDKEKKNHKSSQRGEKQTLSAKLKSNSSRATVEIKRQEKVTQREKITTRLEFYSH